MTPTLIGWGLGYSELEGQQPWTQGWGVLEGLAHIPGAHILGPDTALRLGSHISWALGADIPGALISWALGTYIPGAFMSETLKLGAQTLEAHILGAQAPRALTLGLAAGELDWNCSEK